MSVYICKAIDPVEITESLKKFSFLQDYELLLFCRSGNIKNAAGNQWEPVTTLRSEVLPATIFIEILEIAEMSGRPTVLRSPEGLYLFAVPVLNNTGQSYCIGGVGARDMSLDLAKIETLAQTSGRHPVALLDFFHKFRVTAKKDVEDTAAKVLELVASICDDMQRPSEEVYDKVNAVASICTGIDKSTTCAATLSLYLDTVTILFDIPRLAVIVTEKTCRELSLEGAWSSPASIIRTSPHRLHNVVPKEHSEKSFILGNEFVTLINELVESAICLQFWNKDDDCGLVALLDVELHENEISLLELLNNRVAARLRQLLQDEQLQTTSSQSQKMLSVISSMLLIDDHHQLCEAVINSAAGLVAASGGSLMISDPEKKHLLLASFIGRNPNLAIKSSIPIGVGIAGKVAATGCPLLVNDIEKDMSIARINRAHFKTKSFVSLPMRLNQKVIGVMNLADKENGAAFNEKDLERLSFFADHAAGIIHCSQGKKADRDRKGLVAIDEVTGFYSSGMLLRRMQEEISRSKRQNSNLSIMLVNLCVQHCGSEAESYSATDNSYKTVGAIIKKSLRETDILSVYGESSFCIILPDTGKEASAQVAERIRTAVLCSSATDNGQKGIHTAIGLSSFPKDGNNVAALVNSAEKATSFPTSFTFVPTSPLPQTVGDGSPGRFQHRRLQTNSFPLDISKQLLPLLSR